MAYEIELRALFRTADGTDVESREHKIDVTDTRAELVVGCDEFDKARIDEELVEGAAYHTGWESDPLFIEWQTARVVAA
jgi:hypothetical protein